MEPGVQCSGSCLPGSSDSHFFPLSWTSVSPLPICIIWSSGSLPWIAPAASPSLWVKGVLLGDLTLSSLPAHPEGILGAYLWVSRGGRLWSWVSFSRGSRFTTLTFRAFLCGVPLWGPLNPYFFPPSLPGWDPPSAVEKPLLKCTTAMPCFEHMFHIQNQNSYFGEWIPNNLKPSVWDIPPWGLKMPAAFLGKNTTAQEQLEHIYKQFSALFRWKAANTPYAPSPHADGASQRRRGGRTLNSASWVTACFFLLGVFFDA